MVLYGLTVWNDVMDSSDAEDYVQSSSGRDEFDSDFDLTESYPGKRGRKKGFREIYKEEIKRDDSETEKKGSEWANVHSRIEMW